MPGSGEVDPPPVLRGGVVVDAADRSLRTGLGFYDPREPAGVRRAFFIG
jgi:hypothetical protein